MKGKDLDKFMKNELENYSMELFNKHYELLDLSEIDKLSKYMHDVYHPKWKPIIIDDQDTGYQISNIGNVRGKHGNILKTDMSNAGYLCINGYWNKSSIKIYIHRAVAQAFIPNPDNKPVVNHINGIKTCNWVGNLEWVTIKENTDHAVKTGLMNFKGINHSENVYTEEQVRIACKLLENPDNTLSYISRQSGINRSILYSIRIGNSWKHISSEYNIPKPKSADRFTDDQLEYAAKLLSDPNLSYEIIYHRTGVPYRTLTKIVHMSPNYIQLNNKYHISEIRKPGYIINKKQRRMNDKTAFIYNAIKSGMNKHDIADELVSKFGATDHQLAIRSINKVILKYLHNNE